MIHLNVRLSALTEDGRHVASLHCDFGISGPRCGLAAIWHGYRGPRLSEDPAVFGATRKLDAR